MPDQQVLSFIQSQLDADGNNNEILELLRERFQIDISRRTLQRWIQKYDLQRSLYLSAYHRSTDWIDDVRTLIRSNITREEIVYHLKKNYNEKICARTLDRVLKVHFAVINCWAFQFGD